MMLCLVSVPPGLSIIGLFFLLQVRQIPLAAVVNTNAYILFFEMEQASALNGQREKQCSGKAMPNKTMPSTVTSNGNCSSNGE